MKKLILFMFLTILLVGTVSATDFDDWKFYDDETQTYVIENFFGLGKEIAQLELKSPLTVRTGYGGYEKVAEIEIRNGEFDYEDIIKGIELYDINDDMKRFNRKVDYKIKTYVEVPNYKTICDLDECYNKEAGTRMQEKWVEWDESLLKQETITLGLFTNVRKGDNVEWIIEVYGDERLVQWADWTSALDVDNLAYYTSNRTAGATEDMTGHGYNGTNNGTIRGQKGIIEKAFNYTSEANDFVNVSDLDVELNATPISINLWFKFSDASDGYIIGEQGSGTVGIQHKNGANFRIHYEGFLETTWNTVADQWYMLTMVIDGTNKKLYVNGTEDLTALASATTTFTPANYLLIGSLGGFPFNTPNGTIDEVSIWNRSLSPAEVSDLWNGGAGLQYGGIAPGVPTINLISPIDNYNSTSRDINFLCNATDAEGLTNITLFIDGKANFTNATGYYNFDGVNDKLSMSNPPSLNFSNQSFSISTWIKFTNTTSYGFIISKSSGGFGGYELFRNTGTGKIRFSACKILCNSPYFDIITPLQYNDGNWHHIVGVYEQGVNATISVDGVIVIGETYAPSAIDEVANSFLVGTRGPVGIFWFNGSIDEPRVYNKSLSQAEVTALYNQGRTEILGVVALPELVSYWNLGSNSILDNKGSNDGTNNGATPWIDLNVTPTFSTDGSHNWTCEAYDNTDLSGTTVTRDFDIDSSPKIHVFSPLFNNTNYTNSNIFFNATASLSIGEWRINYNGTNYTLSAINTTVNVEDGTHYLEFWGQNAVTSVWGMNNSVRFFVDTSPQIHVFSPIFNNTNYSQSNIFFNATASLSVSTWRINYNGTNYTLSAINTTVNVEDGTHYLEFWGQNSVTSVWGMNNSVRFFVDTTAPALNITEPFNTTYTDNYAESNSRDISLNWTVSDPNLDTCWYYNTIANVTVGCTTNATITLPYGQHTFFVYANDTFGNLAIEQVTATWLYKVLGNYYTYNPVTIGGVTESFIATLTLGSSESITGADFRYNSTSQAVGINSLGASMYNLTSSFIIPSVSANTNLTFYWTLNLASGNVNTSFRNQTVQNIGIDNCSIYSTVLFNYTMVDEGNQNKIHKNNTYIELDLEIFSLDKSFEVSNFSTAYNQTNPVAVCVNVNLTNETVYALDSTVRYRAENYSIEHYNIQNFILRSTTIPQSITLYDLLIDDSTEFQITFKDVNFIAIEDAIIQINRQYVAEGVFKTVEIPKTDSNGQTVAHLVEKDIVYNIIVLKEGVLLGTFNNVIAFCEDALVGSCFITLNALRGGEKSYDYDSDIGLYYDFEYNESTRNLQFDFTTTDGSVKNVSLFGLKMDMLGNTSVCHTFLVSSSGSLICPVPASVGNETVILDIYVNGDLRITDYIRSGTEFDLGDAGYFLMFFLVLSLALMMTQSKMGVIVGVVIGVVASMLLSFMKGGLIGIGSSSIWLIISAIILIWKLNSQGQT